MQSQVREKERRLTKREDAIDRDATMFYLYCIEGDSEALLKLLQRMVETGSPLTHIIQLPLLKYMGWSVTAKLESDEAYRQLLRGLKFPKTQWSMD